MSPSTPTSDIVLERSSTRIVDELHVAPATDRNSPTIRVDPSTSTVRLDRGGGDLDPVIRVGPGPSASTASLKDEGDRAPKGTLRLNESSGDRSIILTSEEGVGLFELREGRNVKTKLAADQSDDPGAGGSISVHNSDGTDAVVARAVSPLSLPFDPPGEVDDPTGDPPDRIPSGLVEVNDPAGTTTGRLYGGALELTGTTPDGGEVVMMERIENRPTNISIHISGSEQSDWGVDNDNRPRVRFDGWNAQLDLGRGDLGRSRPGVSGALNLRYEGGNFVSMGTREGDGYLSGSIEYRHGKTGGGGGTITAASEKSDEYPETGLLFTRTTPVLLVGENFTVADEQDVKERAISKVGPTLAPDGHLAEHGETVEIELTFGDDTRTIVSNKQSQNFELRAVIKPKIEARVGLLFHTGALGDPSTKTLELKRPNEATIEEIDETDNGGVTNYKLDLVAEDTYGTDTVTIEVTN